MKSEQYTEVSRFGRVGVFKVPMWRSASGDAEFASRIDGKGFSCPHRTLKACEKEAMLTERSLKISDSFDDLFRNS